MLAQTQEFNDNVGNKETEMCFNCHLYKTIDEFRTPQGKQICKECYDKFIELSKKLRVTWKEKPRKARSMFMHEYIINDVIAVIGNKEIFIRGYGGYDEYYNKDMDRADIFKMQLQFLENSLKYFTFHCGAWLDELKKKEPISPIEFVKWIKENNYNFGSYYDCSIEYLKDYDLFDFSGNLNNVSCAFNFRIYDKKYLKELIEVLKDKYYKNIKLKLKGEK